MTVVDLHDSNWAGVVYLTGGGSLLLSQLLCVPGASSTILNAGIPYSSQALTQLLGCDIQQACSEVTARNLAMKAFMDAQKIGSNRGLFGLGITASLSTNREKKGVVRAFIALQTSRRSQVTKVEFQDATSRQEQESFLAHVAFAKLYNGLDLGSDSAPNCPTQTATAVDSHEQLFTSKPIALGARTKAFLPGSFNPVHEGHRHMRTLAQDILGTEVQYELSIKNVDKLPLDYFDLNRRIDQFKVDEIVLTNLPHFYHKAKYLGQDQAVTFVIGVDTFARILEPKFYGDSLELNDVICFFIETGIKFLVFGRTVENKFMTLLDLDVPKDLLPLCMQVGQAQFQCDLASSLLRNEN